MTKATQSHYLDQMIYMVEEEISRKEREGKAPGKMYLHLKNLKWFREEFFNEEESNPS